MDVLLREIRDGAGGFTSSRDSELSVAEVSIGCGSDQRIQLLGRGVGARHAVIRGGRQPSLSCVAGLRATVNGKEVRSARLDVGDCIDIGGHQLTLAAAPTGFDLAIELRPNARIASSDFEAAFRTDLKQTWLGKRHVAWLLMGLTVALGLVVPFAALRPGRVAPARSALAPIQTVASAFWSTGPLAPGHRQLMGDRCGTCHQTLFTQVQDGACQGCHKTSGAHVAESKLAQTIFGPAGRCASCHREHDEPTGNLVDRSDRGCVACHARAPEAFGALKGQAVTGFGAGHHPEFGASRPKVAMSDSGLKFSHTQHLDANRVRKGDRGTLACADCHKPSADGEHFQLPTMATNCVGCHELTFDPDAPDRQLPHGKPRDIVRTLEDYFAHKLSDPNAPQGPARVRRRLPGHEDEPEEEICKGPVVACARQLAAREIQSQFERRGCISCHQVKDTRSTDLTTRFQVAAIRLGHDAYPAARFPHNKHLTQGGIMGDTACLSCHAGGNALGGDLRLPDLPICESCHTDAASRDRTRLQCVSCHSYHPRS